MAEALRFLPFGDTALTVELGDRIDPELSGRVLALDAALQDEWPDGLLESVPTFRSLTLHFDPLRLTPAAIEALVGRALARAGTATARGASWRLPVCYAGELGPDLEAVASEKGCRPEEVVARHAAADYLVYAIGFLPGLPYMGPAPPSLDLPRRQNPRTRVPERSVAIAMGLSVIYPVESPGGWHLLGRTPVRMFDADHSPPALLAPGDRVRFEPIDRATFDRLEQDPPDWATLQVGAS